METTTKASLRIGACLSLTGKYSRFGQQAAIGLRAWQGLSAGVDLQVEDDGSDREQVAPSIRRLRSRCDLLLGPYSTGLMRAAGATAAELDTLIWNHGGAGDDVQVAHPGHVISVLTPARRYAEPFLSLLVREQTRVPLWIVHGKGRFSRQVADGAQELAARLGIQAALQAPDALLPADIPGTWDLFSSGSFEEDVATVERVRSLPRPPRALCAVAAGVREFTSAIAKADGIYGIAQWFAGREAPPQVGPSEAEFLTACSRLTPSRPDYPTTQAAAAAVLATHCATVAGSTEPTALWAVATSLETCTFFGEFRIDPVTGTQVMHETVLVRWMGGEPTVV
jgi:Periplasmic binding protein